MSMTIAVGMSGGVDSAMAALRLKRQGFDVVGLTMKIWSGRLELPHPVRSACYGPGEAHEIENAQRCAERLGIPHHTIDLADAFEERVLEYFRRDHRAGRTPNPCMICNRELKFGLLPEMARRAGFTFDRFATGHYARITGPEADGSHRLRRGVDPAKDQSYFLYWLTMAQLPGLLFPLGDSTKAETRQLAIEAGFPELAAQHESQDFYEGDDYTQLFPGENLKPGPIVDGSGKELGRHDGAMRFTRGQRSGLGVASAQRLYVKTRDMQTGAVVVGPRDEIMSTRCHVADATWVNGPPATPFISAGVCCRYHQKPIESQLTPGGPRAETVEITFAAPVFGVTCGQAAVFYDGDMVLGGGWINEV
ncbi:MAG: tRNA 2-thiouridine(34) synthase MnmA [bacterium]